MRVAIAAAGGVDIVRSAVGARGATEDCKKWGKQVLAFLVSTEAEEAAAQKRYAGGNFQKLAAEETYDMN